MYNDYQLQCKTPETAGLGMGQYIPPTKRQKLVQMKEQIEAALLKVNTAIEALDAQPELEKFMNVIEAAGV